MKTLVLSLALMPFCSIAQDAELDSLHKHCPCVSRFNLEKALKLKHKTPVLGRGNIIQVKCSGASYFFLIPPRGKASDSIFLNGDRKFKASDKIISSGTRWFYVKTSDSVDMKYDFETKSWSTEKLRAEPLGEERF